MTEQPILFSGPMVRALLAGTKTQTRRIVKPQPTLESRGLLGHPRLAGHFAEHVFGSCLVLMAGSPYGRTGERLWVRESWSHDAPNLETCRSAHEDACGGIAYGPYYRATEVAPDTLRWRPSIHMPRWASRITLEITDVRVERLQEITEEDAEAEGVKPFPFDPEGDQWSDGTHRTAFNYLWNEINGWSPDSWSSNPWVWVIAFKRVEAT